jgi:hypothetical protein
MSHGQGKRKRKRPDKAVQKAAGKWGRLAGRAPAGPPESQPCGFQTTVAPESPVR